MKELPKYICYSRRYNRYVFSRTINTKNYKKTFRTLQSALVHLYQFNQLLEYNVDNINILFD